MVVALLSLANRSTRKNRRHGLLLVFEMPSKIPFAAIRQVAWFVVVIFQPPPPPPPEIDALARCLQYR